jgi:hypothetical protein
VLARRRTIEGCVVVPDEERRVDLWLLIVCNIGLVGLAISQPLPDDIFYILSLVLVWVVVIGSHFEDRRHRNEKRRRKGPFGGFGAGQ